MNNCTILDKAKIYMLKTNERYLKGSNQYTLLDKIVNFLMSKA